MKYITVHPNPKNAWRGIGHSFTCWLVSYILAKKYKLKFIHQPFYGTTDGSFAPKGSNANQITVPVSMWENFLDFGNGELTLKDLPTNIEIIQLPHMNANILDKKKNYEEVKWDHPIFKKYLIEEHKENVLFKISELEQGQFIVIDWDFYKNNDLKKKYSNSEQVKNFENYFIKDYINCAIHIRRGDVTKNLQYGRWEDLNYYLSIIENINNIKFDKSIKYHIYTKDMLDNEIKQLLTFKATHNLNIELHIDENVFCTFYHFTKADIFIMGCGTFSVLAAYLSNGIKICKEWDIFWNNFPKDIKDIIEVSADGSFDENKLMEAMV